ncbi:Haloacid dehalogenase-like hydrolase family protein [Spironucleus salmonicida]|uniref:Haloacid dehalogenase-like hydrolase family protein n=1 Tax=Spironucleus salmonicida TaxID=348837 RepID=V6LWL6_9EUKA|nr:Haloacid dehalogenase-like hydrolase family protein [Spironucleus salmonicida]|eukprot:EST48643.1 Haloacid dehalogenase-like hydrolase family protein [Spironucleus salmonicida]
MTIVFFDLDGVLVKECGVAEYGYAYLLNLLADPVFDLSQAPDPKYFKIASELRPKIKGRHPIAKVEIIYKLLQISAAQIARFPPVMSVELWYAAQRTFIVKNHPVASYIVPGAKELIQRMKSANITLATLTANEAGQAKWLLEYCCVEFDHIFGYDLERPDLVLKQDLPRQFLRENHFERVFVIGDGVPDVLAGNILGVSIGIAWGDDNYQKLQENGASLVCRGVEVEKIMTFVE